MEKENDETPYAASSDNSANIARYGKDYLIESGLFDFVQRNILKIVLDDSNQYSVDEAKRLIEKFERDEK